MKNIFSSSQIKEVEHLAANYLNINSLELMKKAGKSVYNYVQQFNKILVVTGSGNNAGDGFVIANQAFNQGKEVVVLNLVDISELPTNAKQTAFEYIKSGGAMLDKLEDQKFDCIVDAIFGIGLNRLITEKFHDAIKWINMQGATRVSVDIPSGLEANTGNVLGCAIKADMTVTILCYKSGLVTNNGKDYCGAIFCEELNVPEVIYANLNSRIHLLTNKDLKHCKFNRLNNSHKGMFGSIVIAGGHDGMLGALILSGQAALRSGCGLVEVVSNSKRSVMISIRCPELMTAESIKGSRLLNNADVIAVGPGLGLNADSKLVVEYCIEQDKSMVIDADALILISNNYKFKNQVVLTPHPKEAASLLNSSVNRIQKDRIKSAKEISRKYNVVTVLKGSGTVISDPEGNVFICPFGFSGMATAGMGDVLTGMIASLLAQGFSCLDAATTSVLWHAIAAENCNKGNSLIASDVIHRLSKEIM